MRNAGLQLIASRQFSIQDQQDFAKFSGDVNPIHLDAVYSRRTTYGQCIVHGVHSLLWALDSLYRICSEDISKVSISFLHPIFLGETIICEWNGNRKLAIKSDDTTLATITFNFVAQSSREQSTNVPHATPRRKANFELLSPRNFSFIDAAGLNVTPVTHVSDYVAAQQLFPNLCARHGSAFVGEIATTSYIVGMECPGLQSLFGSLSFELTGPQSKRSFQVLSSDDRFGLLVIAFNGHFISATIDAFYRPQFIVSPDMIQISKLIEANEFQNVRALVIGGSRGLGASVARIIGAGGGQVVITYNSGELESKAICAEINNFGSACRTVYYSATSEEASNLNLANYDQIYYFASPPILRERGEESSKKLYAIYKRFYVDSFKSLCEKIRVAKHTCSIFYPSTIFLEESADGFKSYCAAKMEGELICRDMNSDSMAKVIVQRLPRLATDQNQAFIPENLADPIATMLPLVRAMTNT
jgi:acyl dehydratase